MILVHSAVFARPYNTMKCEVLLQVITASPSIDVEEHYKVRAFQEMLYGNVPEAQAIRAKYESVQIVYRNVVVKNFEFTDPVKIQLERLEGLLHEAQLKDEDAKGRLRTVCRPLNAMEEAIELCNKSKADLAEIEARYEKAKAELRPRARSVISAPYSVLVEHCEPSAETAGAQKTEEKQTAAEPTAQESEKEGHNRVMADYALAVQVARERVAKTATSASNPKTEGQNGKEILADAVELPKEQTERAAATAVNTETV